MDLVFVEIGSKRYAFPAQEVREVLPLVEPTPIPSWPENALGVINVRGELLPLVDTAPILGRSPIPIRTTHQIVVLSAFDRRWGVLVEAVEDVRQGRVSHNQLAAAGGLVEAPAICQGLTVEPGGAAIVVLSPTGLLQSMSGLAPMASGALA